jgi:hypothetical protein
MVIIGPRIENVEGLSPEECANAKSIVESLGVSIEERGYKDVFDEITSNDAGNGGKSPVRNTLPVNQIPGVPCEECYPVMVVLASGDDPESQTGLPQSLRRLRSHLIRCIGTTKVVILVTDTWEANVVEESLQDLSAHEENGVLVLLLLAVGNRLKPHPIDQ